VVDGASEGQRRGGGGSNGAEEQGDAGREGRLSGEGLQGEVVGEGGEVWTGVTVVLQH